VVVAGGMCEGSDKMNLVSGNSSLGRDVLNRACGRCTVLCTRHVHTYKARFERRAGIRPPLLKSYGPPLTRVEVLPTLELV
jgi:hypothetical protein